VKKALVVGAGLPLDTRTSTIYVDDSGVKAAGNRILVIGGIKIRKHGQLLRAIRHVRDLSGFEREFKFSEINKGSASAYYAMIDELEKSDAHLIATVTQRPPGTGDSGWRYYAKITAGLLQGIVNRNELVTVLMDNVSTPRGVAFEDIVRGNVNRRLGAMRVVTAACHDSRSSDGLQVADLVAGAIAFERRRLAGESGKVDSTKGRIVQRLKAAFGLEELTDVRTDRVNIHTWKQATKPMSRQVPPTARPILARQAGVPA
jgi:Protein of unknown function (DUF3800)